MTQRTDSLANMRLGPYLLAEVIGRGGAAAVYRAHQVSLGRDVAIKVLHRSADPQFAARFAREARAIAQLQHPNILPVYDFGEEGELQYLVMRYVEGGRTLRDLLASGPLEPAQALRLIARLLDALHYAHGRGIVHRDIKPGNVLLPEPDWPLLADFGIARFGGEASQLTMTGQTIGTPDYIAPEQATGQPVDARADIYSTGVMLYEMLVGRTPFRGESALAVVLQHIQQPPPAPRLFNPALPAALEPVLLKALAKDPNERFQTAAELAEVLSGLAAQLERAAPVSLPASARPAVPPLAPEPETAPALEPEPPPAPAAPAAPPRGRARPWMIVAALALLAVVVGIILARGNAARTEAAAGLPVLLDDDVWQGGYRYSAGRTYGGRTATWIYGAHTQYSSMHAEFELQASPACTAQLSVEGMDSEGAAKTPILVEVNGTEIYRGPNPLPDDDYELETGTWDVHAFTFDGGLLRAGRNQVQISNLAEGEFGRPPFFMLDRAEIACAP